ncbi:hypothetical protein EKD00_09315 [Chlorobium phaeovibrioides]|uniref:glutamate mutase L n=1 Tax=Chlorobium phaeovibrioides TaxID=1094 RepID=UPI000F819C8A|nr:glutamate mutase L [Chlorobium phaeovibrioides]RTY33464.1 hypothetical protein EKD00_09315 [Chlorobium phaeovibrioides]
MRSEIIPNSVFVDIGSTIIKYYRFDEFGNISDGGYYPRDYEQVVGVQVWKILMNELSLLPGRDRVRICSSANGGLGVGVLGYTERFSSRWAAKAVFNAGGNVYWASTVHELLNKVIIPVDMLVIACGVDGSPVNRQIIWLDQILKLGVISETIVFSGNANLREHVLSRWPEAIVSNNIFGEDLRWVGNELQLIISEAYLRDLVLSKGIEGLQVFSEVPILPTPAVLQESYGAILRGETAFHFPLPLLLLDVGGATTDVYYGSELIADDEENRPYTPENRHVFTHLGVSASREILLQNIALYDHLADFLKVLDPVNYNRNYIALREGDWQGVTEEFLAESCYFLALEACVHGRYGINKLNIERVAAIVVTGGASQLCQIERFQQIALLCGACNAMVQVDGNYQIWIEGMARTKILTLKENIDGTK